MNRPTNFTLRQNGLFSLGTGIVLMIIALSGLAMSFSLLNQPTNKNVYAGSCSCNPPPEAGTGYTDNFCFHPPKTSGCFMTYPGGYCDPNGDGSYEDGDWVQGYNEYKSICGSVSPTSPPFDQQPTNPPATPGITSAQPISPTVTRPAGTVTPTYLPSATPITSVTPTYLPTATPTKLPTPTQLPTPTPLPELCKDVVRNGPSSTKYDLIFLTDGYDSVDKQIADIKTSINYLKSKNLSNNIINKFNFIAYTNLFKKFNVTGDCPANMCWDYDNARDTMRECPDADGYALLIHIPTVDEFVHMPEEERNLKMNFFLSFKNVVGRANGVSSNSFAVMSIRLNAFPHELTHAIAGAWDEYDIHKNSSGQGDLPLNCAREDNSSHNQNIACPRWQKDFPNVGCYSGCLFSDLFRPALDSTMKNVDYPEFNAPTLKMWENALANFH